MSSSKRFLLILGIVSVMGWIGINYAFGPAGLSRAYLDEYRVKHDHYLSITKSVAFRLSEQRPHLHGPGTEGAPESLEDDIAFVAQYRANPAFVAEQNRLKWYNLLFDLFNAGLVVVLIVRFAKRPLLNLIDEKIAELRAKMDAIAEARKQAEERRQEARNQIDDLPNEERRVAQDMQERLAREMAELEEANQRSLDMMQQDLEDRKRKEEYVAHALVKEELVNASIARLAELCRGRQSQAACQSELIDEFATELETLS
ncbi:MAG: hypothetical protein GWP08_14470 [Nitrospiraceae bacterium]|nr:hypothetical protein [Nitrospiraceae bacterium]